MLDRPANRDVTRLTFSFLALLAMVAGSGWVALPFLAATVWGATIVIATWPVLLAVQRVLGGKRGPAVAVMVVLLLAVLIVPIGIALSALGDGAGRLAEVVRAVTHEGLPPPPAWVRRVPVVGSSLAERWLAASGDPALVAATVQPYLRDGARWVAARVGSVGSTVVQLLLTVAASGILFASGEKAAAGVRRFLRRLAGPRGEEMATLAARSVRAVALGIVVTALSQTVLAGVGLGLAGVPHATVLTAVTFVLCIAQLGPLLVMAPATIWVYATGSPGRGTVLAVFTVVAITLDNFLRPFLIRKGADLPLLLILVGVIGGILGFGVVGLFVGPVILAVSWTLLASWVAEQDETGARTSRVPGA